MLTIPINSLGGNQIVKARTLRSPVVMLDAVTMRVPSSSREERDHIVRFDSAESPRECSCSCEAGEHGQPRWAMARALDALTALAVNNIYIARAFAAVEPGETRASAAPARASSASSGQDGEPLMFYMRSEAAGARCS